MNKKKYENAILYFCKELGGEIRGKKKLAKLLYFLDFDLFEKYHRSLSGDIYKALPMGPVPLALEEMVQLMINKNILTKEAIQEREGYTPTEVFHNQSDPDMKVFDPQESEMLRRVILLYGHLNGKQLEELSHSEAPYVGTEPLKEISYELAYYRGTEFAT